MTLMKRSVTKAALDKYPLCSKIARHKLEDIALQVSTSPDVYASGIKQILHPDIMLKISVTLATL